MKRRFLYLMLALQMTHSLADTTSSLEVPPIMNQFLLTIRSLQPYMVSERKFSDSKNAVRIQRDLDTLAALSKNLKHEQRLSTPFFQVMTDALPKHLNELDADFKKGLKPFARTMLNATLDGCSSCHSQVTSRNSNLWKFSSKELSGSPFEKAEFLFAVRQYDEALSLYRQVIETYRPTATGFFPASAQDSLSRKMSIFLRAKRDLSGAQEEIEKDVKFPVIPELIKRDLNESLATIHELKTIRTPDLERASANEMESFAATTLCRFAKPGLSKRWNSAAPLYISGLLYEYAQKRSSKELTPGIFFWLAKSEKSISKSYFFPLTEIYLKECISRFPISLEAKLCFNELEEIVTAGYTGSLGTDIPSEDRAELNQLRGLLKP